MKYIDNGDGFRPILELTRRNLDTLLQKLDDPLSAKTLICPEQKIYVRAVEDAEHYADRAAGEVHMPTETIKGQIRAVFDDADEYPSWQSMLEEIKGIVGYMEVGA